MKKNQRGTVGDLVGQLGRKAPYDLAEEWDNVGFIVGDAELLVTGIVVAVNLGPEALAAAAKSGANVIVCHHPPIFKPISKVTRSAAPYLYDAIRNGFNVIAMHTNFDLSSKKLSKNLARTLGGEFKDFLAPRGGEELPRSARLGKFITYVPEKDLNAVREAVCAAGAGKIGAYSQCSFSVEGEGTFLGGPDSNPITGTPGVLERAKERKLEVLFPWNSLSKIIQAARAAHPYEEMAYDVLELAQPSRSLGYGFVADYGSRQRAAADGDAGHLAFHNLLDNVKQTFQLRTVTIVGPGLSDSQLRIRRLAYSPGSGSSFVNAAASKGADVYICGEVGYHQMLEARQKGLTLIILGHSYSERFFVETVSEWCEAIGPVEKVFETIHETQ